MTKSFLLKLLLIIFGIVAVLIMFLISVKYFISSLPETAPIEVVANTKSANVSAEKPDLISNNKVEKNSQLQVKADTFLNLFDNMPTVPFYLKDEPILKTGTNTERGLAYTICEPGNKPTIFIKKVFYQKANQKQIDNVVKHELVHAWFCRKGVQVGHDEQFRKKFEPFKV